MEELCTFSVGPWECVISKAEPGTLVYRQVARLAATVHCDGKPFAGYAYTKARHDDGTLSEDGMGLPEEPDFVVFALPLQDLAKLDSCLAHIHRLLRGRYDCLDDAERDSRPNIRFPPGGSPNGGAGDGEGRR